MARIEEYADLDLEEPTMVEGLPGIGLVGKIAADHLVGQFGMTEYAACRCEGLPDVAVYHEGDREVKAPVRIYADEARDLLVLQSDVPVSPERAAAFADCVTGWLAGKGALPVYLSGLPAEREGAPALYGIGTGRGADALDDHGVAPPTESGLISGPTGALVAAAGEQGLDSAAVVVEAAREFPDPAAAEVLLREAVGPIAGVEVDTDALTEQADRIAAARENLAQRMQEADEESSQARPLGMYQ
jgi:uncharacterized protein